MAEISRLPHVLLNDMGLQKQVGTKVHAFIPACLFGYFSVVESVGSGYPGAQ